MRKINLYTDGACLNNPGPGGWGFVVKTEEGVLVYEEGGGTFATTNNQMELTAVIKGLQWVTKHFGREKLDVVITSDSKYVIQGITEWTKGWVKRGWRNAKGQPVANRELWEQLIPLDKAPARTTWRWVKGHAGHPENERCDEIASIYAESYAREAA